MAYIEQCTECGSELEIVGGSFEAEGIILQRNGFCTIDAKTFNTSDERVRCIECKKAYPLEELYLEKNTFLDLLRSGIDIHCDLIIGNVEMPATLVWDEGCKITEYGIECFRPIMEAKYSILPNGTSKSTAIMLNSVPGSAWQLPATSEAPSTHVFLVKNRLPKQLCYNKLRR